MPKRDPKPRAPLPVVLLGAEGLEYLSTGPDGSLYARSEEPVEPGAPCAARAAALVRSTGQAPGPCIVALGSTIVKQRVLGLPEMPAKDLRQILQRKAAALIEAAPEETLFTALPMGLEKDAKEHKWMLLAMRRTVYLGLRYAMRDQGFIVRRVVSERMALASAAETVTDGAADEACIAVGMEVGACGVHLIHDGELVHQTVLTAQFDDEATMAKVLVQELRGFDAFWRRRSRGGAVGRVVLIGFAPRWAERLEFAVRAALPTSKIQRLVREGTDGRKSARMVALAACRSESAVQVSLAAPLAPRKRSIILVAAASAALAIGLAIVTLDGAEGRKLELEAERESFAARAVNLDRLLAEQAHIEATLDAVARHQKRLAYLGSYGLPLEDSLREVIGVIGTNGSVTNVSFVGDPDNGFGVQIAGEIPATPVASQRAIDTMLAASESATLLTDFTVATPRMTSTSGPTLGFNAEARLK